MPIYTFVCVRCGQVQDIRVSEYMDEGQTIRTELCSECQYDELKRTYTAVEPKIKGCTTPARKG